MRRPLQRNTLREYYAAIPAHSLPGLQRLGFMLSLLSTGGSGWRVLLSTEYGSSHLPPVKVRPARQACPRGARECGVKGGVHVYFRVRL